MRRFFVIILLSSFLQASFAQDSTTNNYGKEPKATFEIKINGKKYLVKENEELKLDTTFTKPSISIKLSDYRAFINDAVSFQYPRYLSFAYEEDEGYKNWTLNGNDVVVLIFEIDGYISTESFIEEMCSKFGSENCKIDSVNRKLGAKNYETKQLKVSIAGQNLNYDFYAINLDDDKSRFIVFQDLLEENGNGTKEFSAIFKIISSSIILK
ncbi:hypothetical protein BH10BAC2_BH10BAC2_35700 [soil metagenome]